MVFRSDTAKVFLTGLAIAAITSAAYVKLPQSGFINFDDDCYVSSNSIVRNGITLTGVKWAFSTFFQGTWHPLTWLSHMLDCQLFGTDPGWHHLTNLILHILNSVLLFVILKTATGSIRKSAFVAAVFAVHPVHTESVAWVSERKDVLSTFFGLLATVFYVAYTKKHCRLPIADCRFLKSKIDNQQSKITYALCLLAYVLSLMSKSMLVTLPFVFLLLDYWPLGRMEPGKRTVMRTVVYFTSGFWSSSSRRNVISAELFTCSYMGLRKLSR